MEEFMEMQSWEVAMQKFVMRSCVMLVLGGCLIPVSGVEAAQQGSHIRRQEYQWSPLHWAVRYNDEATVRDLATGRNLEARDALGRTPLHIAAMFGLEEMVALLLERGADVNARDQWGATPLYRLVLMKRYRGWEHSGIAAKLRTAGGVKMGMHGQLE